jgi:CMP-N,N'-diacetyllegionaminic acid synthase
LVEPDGSILAFIGARGGSKGLPGKNIRNLGGKPLIQWTWESAVSSKYVSSVFISTDCEEIASTCRDFGADVPVLRPTELATDEAPIGDAIAHAVDWMREHAGKEVKYILLLQPTSPLRNTQHIDEAIEQYFRDRQDSQETLVSGYSAPPKTGWLCEVSDKGYLDFVFGEAKSIGTRQRQRLAERFYPNGAIYISPISGFDGNFYSEKTQLYKMSPEDSVDIDTLEDFKNVQRQLLR